MRDTSLAQAATLRNVVPIDAADERPEIALARAFNPDTIDGQAAEIRRLKTENARLNVRLARADVATALRVAFVKWLMTDAYSLVVEIPDHEPFVIVSAFDEPHKYAAPFGKFLVAALHGGQLLEHLARKDGGEIVIPREVENLMREVRR